MNDDDDQHFACESVAPRTYPLDHYRDLYLNKNIENLITHRFDLI